MEPLLLQMVRQTIHPTLGCLGLAPSRLSKQWGIDILPIFLLRLGSSRLMWIASLALSGDLGRVFIDNAEVIDGGERVVKILAVFQYGRCCRFGPNRFGPPSMTSALSIKTPSQVTREAKEAIHIRRLDPSLNRNIGKMSIPHCFDNLLGAKPKHPRVGELSVAPSVEEVAPPTQIPGINLTQFNNIGNFRPNVAVHIPRHSTRACRARNLFN